MTKTDFKKISAHETPDRSPGFLLWHISTAWRSSIETVLKPEGLTHPQFVILATLGWLTRHGDRTTQAAVGKMAGLDPNTTSQIIRGLEQKGLIRRETSLDARAKNPLLTIKGDGILRNALPAVEAADAHFFGILSKEEMMCMVDIFQKLASKK
ncbi:MAG: MarR family transcriptional regulator [Chlamydiota bacterium]